jgi:undecaprenyl-diphosphatase
LLSANIDQSIYNSIHAGGQTNLMDNAMKVVEYGSSPTALALGNISVFYFGGEKEKSNAKLAVTSWAGAFATTTLIKGMVNRERPEHQHVSRWDSSFPSGHTSSWFALATVYSNKYPKYALPLYGAGVLVGLSRVYLGQHYPSDVLAGAVIGIGIGYLTLKLEKQIKKLPFF